MPTFTFECESEAELALVRQAAEFAAEMHRLAAEAPSGEVLAGVERRALDAGRQLLRDAIRSAAQARIDAAEENGAPPGSARARPRSG